MAPGLGGSWVTEGDLSNLNEPMERGTRAAWCPALVNLKRYPVPEHTMHTVRGTQRRYRENGGNGYRTTLFFCWNCAVLVDGDSWHCPIHGIDYCMECKGSFGRDQIPSLFFDYQYINERAEYEGLTPEDHDFHTGLYLLEDVPRTCFGNPKHVSFQERDNKIDEQMEKCRKLAAAELQRGAVVEWCH